MHRMGWGSESVCESCSWEFWYVFWLDEIVRIGGWSLLQVHTLVEDLALELVLDFEWYIVLVVTCFLGAMLSWSALGIIGVKYLEYRSLDEPELSPLDAKFMSVYDTMGISAWPSLFLSEPFGDGAQWVPARTRRSTTFLCVVVWTWWLESWLLGFYNGLW